MSCCTFFGHRECPSQVESVLRKNIEYVIEHEGVTTFYVGNNGNFDRLASKILNELCASNKDIKLYIVLAYMPKEQNCFENAITIFPENIEYAPPRFAIDHRNKYMLDKADIVLTYVVYNTGGAAKFEKKAINKNKKVINIAKQ